MKIYKSNERGTANHGWLKANHSFSFADYYNPELIGYGALRVLNDDIIAPDKGFPNHPHDNMEIITIVTKGELRHEDSTGKKAILTPGWVQVMSAGSGITHSEFNHSQTENLELFQIWIQTGSKDISPRHAEKEFEYLKGWTKVAGDDSLEINQDAEVSIGLLNEADRINLKPSKGKGIFIMTIEGEFTANGKLIQRRDAVSFEEEITLKFKDKTQLLRIDVPL